MKKFSLFLLIIFVLIRCASAPPAQTAAKVNTSAFTVNGLQVIVKHIPGDPVVATGLFIRGGTRAVPVNQAGIERYFLETAVRGTESLSKDALNSRLESMGTSLNPEVQYDYTGLTMKSLHRSFDESWQIFQDVLLHPSFPEDEIELVREQILSSIRSEQDDPDSYVSLLANNLFYQGQPYAVSLYGTEASIKGITRSSLQRYYRQQVTTSRTVLVVVGDITPEALRPRAEALANALPAGTAFQPETGAGGFQPGPADVKVAQRQLPTNYILGMCPAPAPGSQDYPAFSTAFRILHDRLFEEVRTKRNLSYAPASGVSRRANNYGYIYVTTAYPDTTIKVMFQTIRNMEQKPLSAQTLQNEITQSITRDLMNRETAMAQMDQLAMAEIVGGDWQTAGAYMAKLRRLTPRDIQQAVQTYAHHFHFGVVGDPNKIDTSLFTSM